MGSNQDSFDANNKATYSSVNSPMSAKSPPFSPGSSNQFFNSSKFSASSDSNSPNPQFTRSPSFNQNNSFRKNSFQNNYNNNNNQTPTGGNNMRYHNQNFQHHNNSGNPNSVSLYVKADNVNEDLLRSIFNANVSNAKLISIDVKTK